MRWLFNWVVGCEKGDEDGNVVVVDRSTEMRNGIVHRNRLRVGKLGGCTPAPDGEP